MLKVCTRLDLQCHINVIYVGSVIFPRVLGNISISMKCGDITVDVRARV